MKIHHDSAQYMISWWQDKWLIEIECWATKCTQNLWSVLITGELYYIDGLMRGRCSSIANALELRLCCTNPSICIYFKEQSHHDHGEVTLWDTLFQCFTLFTICVENHQTGASLHRSDNNAEWLLWNIMWPLCIHLSVKQSNRFAVESNATPESHFHLLMNAMLTPLTHWGRDKMDAISQTTFWSAFSWMKMFEFRFKFHWSLFLRVQLTIFQHWFR